MTCEVCGAVLPDDGGPCASCGRRQSSFTASRLDTLSPSAARAAAETMPWLTSPGLGLGLSPGQPFGDRYTVVEELGAGGMGQVLKAIDRKLAKTVAIKLIRPEAAAHQGALERFRRELTLAQEVTHPNVCRVHDLGEVGGVVYISMEYVVGQTLEDLIQSVGHLSPRQTVTLARQVCAGLQAIHEKAIVHRDLKPGNVMVDRSGHALVMDFGLAYHPADDRLTNAGAVLGTLAYLSPEQAREHATDLRSDIYSLGLMLYEMLTGRRPPGDGGGLPLALREASDPCPPPSHFMPDVPAALDEVVMKCLRREPARRYSSAAELDQALAAVAATFSSGVSAPLRLLGRPPARGWTAAIVVAIAVAVAAALLWGALTWRRRAPPAAGDGAQLAILPLSYEGPPEKSYLKDVLPLVVAESLRDSKAIRVVPFPSARTFAADEDPRAVARGLGARWIVQGRLRVGGSRFHATLRARNGGDGAESWSKTLDGEIPGLLSEADRLATELATVLAGGGPTGRPGTRRDVAALDQYLQGRTFLEGWDVERNYTRAEQAFESAIARDDGFAEAHAMLAVAHWMHYAQTKEPALIQQASAQAERALALAPSLPEAHAASGLVELARGRSAEAASAFEKGLELAPADDFLCRRIAGAYAELGRNAEAEKMYQRAIALRPSYWYNYNSKGSFYFRRGQLAEAREMYRKVIQLRPEADTGYVNLAATHIVAGEHKDAEPLLQLALRVNPSHETRNNLGVVYYAMGRFADAAEQWRKAIEGGSQEPMLFTNLGDACRRTGQAAEARTAYARAVELARTQLELNPRDAETRAMLAIAMAGLGRCPEAAGEARNASQAARSSPLVSYYAAIAASVCGNRREAVRYAAVALEGGAVVDVRTNPDLKPLLEDPAIRRLLPPAPELTRP